MKLTNLVINGDTNKEAILTAIEKLPNNFVKPLSVRVEGSIDEKEEVSLCFKEDVEITTPSPGKIAYFDCTVAYTSFTYKKIDYLLFFH